MSFLKRSKETTSPNPPNTEKYGAMKLLGREFRVIESGLDPVEILAFLDSITGSSETTLKRLEQFVYLQKRAEAMEAMVQEAQRMAEHVKQQAIFEAKAEKDQVIEAAKSIAEEMITQTEKTCIASMEGVSSFILEALTKVKGKVAEMVAMSTQEGQQDLNTTINTIYPDLNTGDKQDEQFVEDLSTPQVEATQISSNAEIEETVPASESEYIPQVAKIDENDNQLDSALEFQPISFGIEGETQPINTETQDDIPKQDNSGAYVGEVILRIPWIGEPSWISQLQQQLAKIPGVHILLRGGSDTDGSVIHLWLDTPIALPSVLLEMTNVETVVEVSKEKKVSEDLASTLGQGITGNLQRATLMVMMSNHNSN
jgi:hypothetical protein